MGFSCGIVGLPNVGKSTIFNALTSAKAASENFPFCTIEPNTGVVPVPDPRLDTLAELAKSEKVIPAQMTFVDIAGLIKGAAQGEGLGNQFLGHIRAADAIIQVVRCFDDENIIHVDGSIDPIRDIQTIETELILSDLDSIQKQTTKYAKQAKSGDKAAIKKNDLLQSLSTFLDEGNLAKNFPEINDEDLATEFSNLLTSKPLLYLANLAEEDSENIHLAKLEEYAKNNQAQVVCICGKVEAEIAELDAEERKEYLEALGIEQSGLDSLTIAGYELLNLITYFTCGPKETRAWTIERSTLAPQAAGKIHSDFEHGFIRAEVISYEDYLAGKGENGARENGKLRVEGKEYEVQDGDVMHFRFNN